MEAKIKPQDVKLNSLVMYNYKGKDEVCIVDSIREEAIECRFVNGMREDLTTGIITVPEHLIGVPLSEDWLIRMGWGKSDDNEYCNNVAHERYVFYYNTMLCSLGIESEKDILWFDCYYVHDIQNKMYSLTGSELTIKDINNI